MKQINRYYLVFGVWCAILAYAVFFGNNVYFNTILLYFGFLGCVTANMKMKRNANLVKKLLICLDNSNKMIIFAT